MNAPLGSAAGGSLPHHSGVWLLFSDTRAVSEIQTVHPSRAGQPVFRLRAAQGRVRTGRKHRTVPRRSGDGPRMDSLEARMNARMPANGWPRHTRGLAHALGTAALLLLAAPAAAGVVHGTLHSSREVEGVRVHNAYPGRASSLPSTRMMGSPRRRRTATALSVARTRTGRPLGSRSVGAAC